MAKQLLIPDGYRTVLEELNGCVRTASLQAQRRVNTELIELYWSIGATLSAQEAAGGWGTGVLNRLADDLRAEFTQVTCPWHRGAGGVFYRMGIRREPRVALPAATSTPSEECELVSIVPQVVGLFPSCPSCPSDVDCGDDALLVGECQALGIRERVVGVGRDSDR